MIISRIPNCWNGSEARHHFAGSRLAGVRRKQLTVAAAEAGAFSWPFLVTQLGLESSRDRVEELRKQELVYAGCGDAHTFNPSRQRQVGSLKFKASLVPVASDLAYGAYR